MYIVVATFSEENGRHRDHWETAETRAEAERKYRDLLKQDDLYTASICAVVKSTDYEPEVL